jgi:hypothetical protein
MIGLFLYHHQLVGAVFLILKIPKPSRYYPVMKLQRSSVTILWRHLRTKVKRSTALGARVKTAQTILVPQPRDVVVMVTLV